MREKILEKRLDKYYAKKTLQRIKEIYLFMYFVDTKIEEYENGYILYIKRKDQKEEYFKRVFSVEFGNWDKLYYSTVINNNTGLEKYIKEILNER